MKKNYITYEQLKEAVDGVKRITQPKLSCEGISFINSKPNGEVVLSSNIIVDITYGDLVKLIEEEKLVPGRKYCIIDYKATSTMGTVEQNIFLNIVVEALSNYCLDENATAYVEGKIDGFIDEPTAENQIIMKFTQMIDGEDIQYKPDEEGLVRGDIFVAGQIVDGIPHIYKTDITSYEADEVDYADDFIWNDRYELNGITYDRWRKVESGGSSMVYALTDIITSRTDTLFNIKYSLKNDTSKFAWADDTETELAVKIYTDDGYWFDYAGDTEIDGEIYHLYSSPEFDYSGPGYFLASTLDSFEVDDMLSVISPDKTTIVEDSYASITHEDWDDEKPYQFLGTIFNGRGVIYYLEDDKGNAAPFDFKNIMFGSDYAFGGESDYSSTYTNVKMENYIVDGVMQLPNNIIRAEEIHNVNIGHDCHDLVIEVEGSDIVKNVDIKPGISSTTITLSSDYTYTEVKPSNSHDIIVE